MYLYHGTSSKNLSKILSEGLLPKELTKHPGYWQGSIVSKPNLVYLTTAYPVYYAQHAAITDNVDLALIRLKVDMHNLYPDEDFVARMLWLADHKQNDLLTYNAIADPFIWKDKWQACLNETGSVCTPNIASSEVDDYVIVNKDDRELIYQLGADAALTPMNYKLLGTYYQLGIKALFDMGRTSALEIIKERNNYIGL